jgi:hypothetical protein
MYLLIFFITRSWVCFIAKLVITSFAADPVQPINGNPVTLTCESVGVPEPDYVIKFENGTNASTQKTYHISKMGSTYAGIYTCIAENIKGNDSATLNLTGQGKIRTFEKNRERVRYLGFACMRGNRLICDAVIDQ